MSFTIASLIKGARSRAAGNQPAGARRTNPYLRFVSIHCGIVFIAFEVLRVVLGVRFKADGPELFGDYALSFLNGAMRDAGVALLLTLPLLALFAFPGRGLRSRVARAGWIFLYGFGWGVFLFLLAAEYFFFEEFKSRFNTVAIDYILYPHEVFINIWDSYPTAKVLAACAGLAALIVWSLSRPLLATISMWPPRGHRSAYLGVSTAIACVFLIAIHPGTPQVSHERLLNELANNGILSLANAAWSRNLEYAGFHPVLPRNECYSRARRLLAEPAATFDGPSDSIERHVAGDSHRPRYNVVLLLEESLGSEFWGALGRRAPSLTPQLDRLSTEGLLFTNMYATGNRTVRGLEGVLSSFPPLPGDSIVKRDRSENVETIARVLQRDGYETVFLYGGRGLFDGMRSFAVHNGYERFIEQKDFAHPTFTTAWGVCNEDLYSRALEECRELNRRGDPFFATVLSVSNHKPYTYPADRIPEKPNRHRSNAVRYTDWALGQFFAAAKKESFWTNTIFIVVADHGARVYGSQSVPIHSYEIPFLVLGPAVVHEPARFSQWGCQLDVAPTILGLIGRPYESMFFGHDLLKSTANQSRALLNHNRDIGLATSNHMVVLGLNKRVEFYHGNPKKGAIVPVETPDEVDREIQLDAMALFQAADDLYMHRRYRVSAPLVTVNTAPH